MHSTLLGRLSRPFAVALVVPVLVSCGGGAKPSPEQTAANGVVFNGADATFARELLLQRSEEFALIDLTTARTLSPELLAFVEDAREVRATEVDQVTTWLTDWGKEVPTTVRDHASGHEGVLHAFDDVERAPDSAFESAWIEAFLTELEESDDIASDEQLNGLYAEAKALADDVDDHNNDEADLLEDLA